MTLGGGQKAHGCVEGGIWRALALLVVLLRVVEEIHACKGFTRGHLRFTPPQEDRPDIIIMKNRGRMRTMISVSDMVSSMSNAPMAQIDMKKVIQFGSVRLTNHVRM